MIFTRTVQFYKTEQIDIEPGIQLRISAKVDGLERVCFVYCNREGLQVGLGNVLRYKTGWWNKIQGYLYRWFWWLFREVRFVTAKDWKTYPGPQKDT